jgi:AcrR family transcriptional regulator
VTADPAGSLRADVRSLVRDRLLDAAVFVFERDGWAKLTMGKVADRAGVSRQTVYNEFGTKPQLAELLIFRELQAFLALVNERLDQADDPVEGIGSAVRGALELAQGNPLLRAVLESAHAGDSDLLPYITQSLDLIETATNAVGEAILRRFPDLPLPPDRFTALADLVVRVVLSHVTQPARSPETVADEIAFLVRSVLGAP